MNLSKIGSFFLSSRSPVIQSSCQAAQPPNKDRRVKSEMPVTHAGCGNGMCFCPGWARNKQSRPQSKLRHGLKKSLVQLQILRPKINGMKLVWKRILRKKKLGHSKCNLLCISVSPSDCFSFWIYFFCSNILNLLPIFPRHQISSVELVWMDSGELMAGGGDGIYLKGTFTSPTIPTPISSPLLYAVPIG